MTSYTKDVHVPPRQRRRWRTARRVLDATDVRRYAVTERVEELTRGPLVFYLLVVLSSAVMTMGSDRRTPVAVAAGAIIAPVAIPLLAVALAVATANNALLRRSVGRLAATVALGVGTAVVVARLMEPEPLALAFEPEPQRITLALAVATGLVSALALTDRRIHPSLPGAMIGWMILQPLADIGRFAAHDDIDAAGRAVQQLATNATGAFLAAVAFFVAFGARYRGPLQELRPTRVAREFGPSVLLLMLASAVATRSSVHQSRLGEREAAVRAIIAREALGANGARLERLRIHETDDALLVVAELTAPTELTAGQVAAIEDSLQGSVDPRAQLRVRSYLAQDADRFGTRFGDGSAFARSERADTLFLARAAGMLRDMTVSWPGVSLASVSQERRHGAHVLTAVFRTPYVVSPAEVGGLERELMRGLRRPVALIVRSALTTDAYSVGYVDAPSLSASARTLDRSR
jgi:uncharacterized membrane protein